MLRDAARGHSRRRETGAIAGILVAATFLLVPTFARATGPVMVTVNTPQFDQKDGNYAVFSGSVTNAPMPDSDSGCPPFGTVGCAAQFALYLAGTPDSFPLGPQLIWGLQGTLTTQLATTINMSTSPDVIAGTTYQATLRAYDSGNVLWESGRSEPFRWPPDELTLSKVRLLGSPSGASTIRYRLGHGGTPFPGKAPVTGAVFDGSKRLGKFVHKVKAGMHTKRLPASIDRKLVEGNRYRVRLDAEDSLKREAHFRDKLKR